MGPRAEARGIRPLWSCAHESAQRASMGPRAEARGILISGLARRPFSAGLLQWGRAPRRAESPPQLAPPSFLVLQWGRAPRRAESDGIALAISGVEVLLQWGRAPRRAE